MEKLCYSCGAKIFLLKDKEGIWRPFDDPEGNLLHKCKSKNNDYNLLRQTITRVSAIEKTIAEIESSLKCILQ